MKVIKYGASWCGPCRTTSENLKACNINFEEIDIDENEDIADNKHITSIPVVEFYNDNEDTPKVTYTGLLTQDKIKEITKNLI